MLRICNAIHLGAPVDLLVDGQKIVTMTPAGHGDLPTDCEIFDAGGLRLLPSLIDAHAHLREPGQTYKEDINTGLEAGLYGGYSHIMCMANTRPVNDNASVTTFMLERARSSHPHGPWLEPIAASTIGLDGKEMSPLGELAEAGCVATSNDCKPMANAELVRRVMEYAADLGLIFIDHCEDPCLAAGWIMNEGEVSGRLGLKGQPGCGEAMQACRDILLAEYLNLPVHIAHVSSKATVDLIAWAKSRGIKVTAETCPHYLLLDDSIMENYNALGKVSPPIRSARDREALREGVKTGIIDIIATDHAPHTMLEKNDTLDHVPCGISGLDTALALVYSLTEKGILDEADICRLMSRRPGEIFGLPFNNFNPGDPANFFLYDPAKEWVVNAEIMKSKSCNTPFLNRTIRGWVCHHWLAGKKMF